MDKGKIVEDGKFRVFKDGRVYRIRNGKETLVKPVTARVGRNKVLRLKTNYYHEGKNKTYTVALLIAQAYLPKNNNQLNGIKYIDGDPLNVSADNLRWETKEEAQNRIHTAKQIVEQGKVICPNCGNKRTPYKNNNIGLCYNCYIKAQKKQAKEEKKLLKMEDIQKKYSDIDFDSLPEKKKEILLSRLSGKTYKEIGEEIGKSAQSVRTLLLRLEKNKAYKKKGDSK